MMASHSEGRLPPQFLSLAQVDVTSEDFNSLPLELQHEILIDLQEVRSTSRSTEASTLQPAADYGWCMCMCMCVQCVCQAAACTGGIATGTFNLLAISRFPFLTTRPCSTLHPPPSNLPPMVSYQRNIITPCAKGGKAQVVAWR